VDIDSKDPKKVDKSLVHNYFSCKNMVIRISGGKLKSVNLEGCQKVELHVESIISELNLMNCKQVKIFSGVQLPSVTVENGNEINLFLNHKTKGCKLFTTCVRSMWV